MSKNTTGIPTKPKRGMAIADANGNATVSLQPPGTYEWEVTQIGILTTGAANSKCSVFVDNVFYCGSNSGNGDAADGNPLQVNNGSVLTVVWSGVTPGATCTANLLVEEMEVGR